MKFNVHGAALRLAFKLSTSTRATIKYLVRATPQTIGKIMSYRMVGSTYLYLSREWKVVFACFESNRVGNAGNSMVD